MLRPEYHHEASGGLYQEIMMKQAFQQNVPSLGRIFKESVSYGFMDNTFVHGYDYWRSLQDDENVLTEEAYNQSDFKRRGINWHEGVIGIVAARIKEKYNKPTILISVKDKLGKGSARSIFGFDIGSHIIKATQSGILL